MSSFAASVSRRQASVCNLLSSSSGDADNDSTKKQLEKDEEVIREKATHNVLSLVLVDGYSAVVVFLLYLVSVESLISIGLSVGLTVYIYNTTDDDESAFDGSVMTWTLLSFAVITPLSSVITMAFRRREDALVDLANLRSTFVELFAAHSLWDWSQNPGDAVNSGRTKSSVNWKDHSDDLLEVIEGICVEMTRYLTLPNFTKARHKITGAFKKEAEKTREVADRLHSSILKRFAKLAYLCEILKREGLPGNEAARIRQWERLLLVNIEKLRMVKTYRTPQALRSFSRLFSIFLPPFYVPYYVQMARDMNSLGTAIAFSVITSLALTSLFEAVSQLEDPFVSISVLDGVNVKHQLVDSFMDDLRMMQRCYFRDHGTADQQAAEQT